MPVMETTPEVSVIDRQEFLSDYFDYQAGEHLTIIGPTGRGKTTLGMQLLKHTAKPEMRAYFLASKPRDETVDEWKKPLGFGTTDVWPPPISFKRRPGWFVQPAQSLKNIKADNEELNRVFTACIMDCYASTDPRIVVADEGHQLQHELKMRTEMEAVWMRGRSLKCGMWALSQRSAHNSMHMYNAPTHLFLFNDPDRRNRVRFSEIGGIQDSRLIEELTANLDEYQVLYLNRNGPYLCVVDP